MGVTPGNKGRFPGFDVLGQARHWDQETAAVVQTRLEAPPALVFFSEGEQRTARALLDRLLANEVEPRLPLLEAVDARLQAGQTDGWHHDHLPPDGETWRLSLAALDDHCRRSCGSAFAELGRTDQIGILDAIRTAEKLGELSAAAVWSLWLRYGCAAFYSHPWAWNEIGFGGPSYPRGYRNIGLGRREPWEVREVDAVDPEPWANRVEAARRRQFGKRYR